MARNPGKRGFFRSVLDAMIAARERQAAQYVNDALLSLDDDALRGYGYTRADLLQRGATTRTFL